MFEQNRYDPIEQTPQPRFGLIHAYYAVMGGFAFYDSFDDDTPKSLFEISTNPRCIVDVPGFNTLIYIMEHFPHIITDITEDYILDQAASSSLSKALLIVQVAWFCTNCASRLFQHLPLSLLEVSTAAHAFCTLITYFVWWSKPLNVATPTLLRERGAREVYALLKCSEDEYDKALEMAQKRAVGDSSALPGTDGSEKIVLAANAMQHLLPTPKRPPLNSGFKSHSHILLPGHYAVSSIAEGPVSMVTTMAMCPILYGLVHFLAWNDHFPTPLERLPWRASSFVVTCSGLVGITMLVSLMLLDSLLSVIKLDLLIIFISIFVIPTAHVLASGFLIAESFRQLPFLDPAAYQLTSWSNYWPHFS